MSIQFFVDSTCDLEHANPIFKNVEILSIPINIGDKTYYDRIDISQEMILQHVAENPKQFPKTSQIAPAVVMKAMTPYLEQGHDIIYLTLSSKFSSCYESGVMAAEELKGRYPQRNIAVVDSLSCSTGMAMILHQGLKHNQLTTPFDIIVDTMRQLADHLRVYFVVGDIKWLGAGGRISKSVAAIGSMLKIVPVLCIDNGAIVLFDKVRGQKKALKRIYEATALEIGDNTQQIVGMIQISNQEEQEKMCQKIKKDLGITKLIIPEEGAGSALTTHIGPQSLGICFFDNLPDNYIPVL